MTHAEMAKHIRNRLKHEGIKAKCSIYTSCGTRYIRIVTPEYGSYFTAQQLEKIGVIACVNKLTNARGEPINMEILIQMTKKDQFDFEFHG